MLTTLLMFIAAIVLSIIAGYYSVIGMTAIFSGAFIPIVLMAGTLETSKVIVASWLYNNWKKTPLLLKSYLTIAVIVLMFITSMGIFGFLSQAHVQQAGAAAQQAAQVQMLEQEIKAQNQVIELATKRLDDLASGAGNGDAGLNARIAQANKVIENANARVQPKIDEQQKIIDQESTKVEARVKDIQTQIADVDQQVAALDDIVKGLVDQQRSVLAQRKRAEQGPEREELSKKKADLLKQIDGVRNAPNSTVDAAKAEIAKIRSEVDAEIKQAQSVINELTGQLGKNVDTTKLTTDMDEQNARIKAATDRLDQLMEEKFKIETETRKLEVEVGPIKYIAQMIYGDQVDGTLLEKAVRWIIMTLIFVFDPLAVLMLIASNQGLAEWKAERKNRKGPTSGGLDGVAEKLLEKVVDKKEAMTAKQEFNALQKTDPDGEHLMSQIRAALAEVLPGKINVDSVIERTMEQPVQPREQSKITLVDSVKISEVPKNTKPTDEIKGVEHQEMIDTMRRVLFNAVENITTPAIKNDEPESVQEQDAVAEPEMVQDEQDDGHVKDTDDLLNKLQRVHAVRLQRFNARTV